MDELRQLLLTPTAEEWRHFAYVLSGLFGFIGIAELIRKSLKFSPEVTRKLVHILTGILIFFTPKLFLVALPPLLMAMVFIVVNGAAVKFGLFKGMHGTDRPTYGTVFYPLSFLILVVLFWYTKPEIVSLAVISLAIGDACAAIVGNAFKSPTIYRLTSDKKSVEGSIAMLLSTWITLIVGMSILFRGGMFPAYFIIVASGAAATTATAWEALSARGLDNLTIPLSVAFVLHYYLIPSTMQDVAQFTFGISLALIIAAASYLLRFLSASGAVATFLLASTVFGIGGWKWTVPILTFFILSSLLSHYGKSRKQSLESVFEKSGPRDYAQVAANGAIPGLIAIAQYAFPLANLFPAYLGAIAAATADTWGTEIGLLSRRRPILITTFEQVERGANGGVTLLGIVGGIVGTAAIGLSAFPWKIGLKTALIVVVAGFIGSLVDSILGATLQASYRCDVCRKTTEKKTHCDQPTQFIHGIRRLDNDAVNWCCVIAGSLIAFTLA